MLNSRLTSMRYAYAVVPQSYIPQRHLIQAALHIQAKRVFVACPKYAMYLWHHLADEQDFKGSLTVVPFEDVAQTRYEGRYDLLIVDQYRHIARTRSRASSAILGLRNGIAGQASRVWALDGSNCKNAWELWGLMRIFGATMLSLARWTTHYSNTRTTKHGDLASSGYRNAAKPELFAMLAGYEPLIARNHPTRPIELLPLSAGTASPPVTIELARMARALRKRVFTETADTLIRDLPLFAPVFDAAGLIRAGSVADWLDDYMADGERYVIVLFNQPSVATIIYERLLHHNPVTLSATTTIPRRTKSIKGFEEGTTRLLLCPIELAWCIAEVDSNIRVFAEQSPFPAENDAARKSNVATIVACEDADYALAIITKLLKDTA